MEDQVKDNPVSEGDRKRPNSLWDISKESTTEADQKGEDQERDEEEGESCNFSCYVTVMLFTCYMIF